MLERVREIIGRLSPRELIVVTAGAAVVAVLLAWGLMIDPALRRMAELDGLIARKNGEIAEMRRVQARYQELAGRTAAVRTRVAPAGGFSLLAFLESTAASNRAGGRIAQIRPQAAQTFEDMREVAAEVRMEGVSLSQIVSFLGALERAPQRLRVKRLQLKTRFKEPELLDATLLVATYEKA